MSQRSPSRYSRYSRRSPNRSITAANLNRPLQRPAGPLSSIGRRSIYGPFNTRWESPVYTSMPRPARSRRRPRRPNQRVGNQENFDPNLPNISEGRLYINFSMANEIARALVEQAEQQRSAVYAGQMTVNEWRNQREPENNVDITNNIILVALAISMMNTHNIEIDIEQPGVLSVRQI